MTAVAATGVSVVMATYNGSAYLDAQLRSILEQLSPQDELLILDDGSSDETNAIADAYARDHPNIRARRNAVNRGVRATFEALLSMATRDIVFLSDQDDLWLPGRKDRMLAALAETGCTAVLTNASVLTDHAVQRSFFPADRPPDVSSIAGNFVRNNYIGCCMAFRKDVLSLALPFPKRISMHDWWLGSCAMALGHVCYLEEPGLLYRRHTNNQSAGRRRRWRIVAADRVGNLLALLTLFRRLRRLRRPARV